MHPRIRRLSSEQMEIDNGLREGRSVRTGRIKFRLSQTREGKTQKLVKDQEEGLEAPSGFEPLHRSFAERPSRLRLTTTSSERLRDHLSKFKVLARIPL